MWVRASEAVSKLSWAEARTHMKIANKALSHVGPGFSPAEQRIPRGLRARASSGFLDGLFSPDPHGCPVQQPAAAAVGHVICTKGDEFPLRSSNMHAAALQTLKVYIPRILEGHTRNTQRMALNAIEESAWPGPALGCCYAAIVHESRLFVLPVPAHIIFGSRGRILCGLRGALVFCGCRQCAVFPQHGERRKGTVRRLSAGREQVLNLQLSLCLVLNGGENI